MSLLGEFDKLGIKLRTGRDGEQRVLCPQCSHQRRKKRDRCLAVRLDGDRGYYNCWHCGFAGAVSERGGMGARPRVQRGDFGEAARRFRYQIFP